MPGTPQRSDTPFQRLWHGFLSARALVALALLLLQGAGLALHQNPEPELLALCALYLVVTVLTRLLAAPLPPDPQPGPSWLPLLGVDLLMVGLLQWLQSGSMNYTPLFGIPILMASVLGSLTLALGPPPRPRCCCWAAPGGAAWIRARAMPRRITCRQHSPAPATSWWRTLRTNWPSAC